MIRYGLYFTVAFSVLAFGSAEVWAYTTLEFVLFLTLALFLLRLRPAKTRSTEKDERGKKDLSIWIPLGLFILLVLFQLAPLPDFMLRHISPATYELYQDTLPDWRDGENAKPADPVIDNDKSRPEEGLAKWRSISINRHGTFSMLLKILVYVGIFFIVLYYAPRERKKHRSYQSVKSHREFPEPGGAPETSEPIYGDEETFAEPRKTGNVVIPAKAGIQCWSQGELAALRQAQGDNVVVSLACPECIEGSNHGFRVKPGMTGGGILQRSHDGQGASSLSEKPAVPGFIFGLIWVIFFLGLFNALFSFLELTSDGAIRWLRPLAPSGIYLGTFKSPNNFSEFLEMVIPLAMGLLLVQNYLEVRRFSRRMKRSIARIAAFFSRTGLLSFGIVMLIPALFLSLSRGGFVTFPVTMVITCIFMIVSYRLHDRYSFGLFSLVIIGGIVFLIMIGAAPVISEFRNLFASGPTSARPQTYIEALAVIRDFPLFGVGLGNWKDIILKYHTMVGRETWQPGIAYNDTLQLAAEMGLPGLACVVSFLFVIFRKAIRALTSGMDIVRRSLILGGLSSMSAALIHCQFDYFFTLPSHAVVFSVVAAITYRLSKEELRAAGRRNESQCHGEPVEP